MASIKSFTDKFSEFRNISKTSKRLLGILWKIDKGLFLGMAGAISIPGFVPFINAYIYKLIIDLVVAFINGAAFNFTQLYLLLGIRFVTIFLQDISFATQSYFETLLWTKFPVYLYQIVLSKLSHLDLQYFEDSSFKDQLEKVKEAYAWRPLNMLSNLFYIEQSLIQLVIALIAITSLNWPLIFLFFLVAIPTFFNQTNYAKITWGLWQSNSPYRKKFWYLSELIQGGQSVKEIKIFQMAKRFLAELNEIYSKFAGENIKVANKQLKSNFLLNIFGTFVYLATEAFIFFSAITKKISIGDITYFTSVIGNFQNGVSGLFRNVAQIYDQGLYVQELFSVLDLKSKITEPPEAIKIDNSKAPKIEFRNVSFTYPGSEQKALDNFSLIIKTGQKIALVGENGAGKTTIVKLLARFYDVAEGEILINGINLKQLDLPTWYKSLGILFQDFIKYEYPLRENIYFGKIYEPENIKEIIQAAEASGASEVVEGFSKGYDQMLGKTFEGGVELSAGQWQKIALARAFLRNAPVLILDEPTAAIDAKAEAQIFDRVEKLSKDKTVIIISHRFSTVRNADEIYVINKGKVTESGTHDQLIKNDGEYATLFKLQAKGYQ